MRTRTTSERGCAQRRRDVEGRAVDPERPVVPWTRSRGRRDAAARAIRGVLTRLHHERAGQAAAAAAAPRRVVEGRRTRSGPSPATSAVGPRGRGSSAASIDGHSERAAACRSLTGDPRAVALGGGEVVAGRPQPVGLARRPRGCSARARDGSSTSGGRRAGGQRLDVLADAGHQRAAVAQLERDVGAESGRDLGEQRVVRAPGACGDSRSAAAASPTRRPSRRDRDALGDRDADRRPVPAGRSRYGGQRLGREVRAVDAGADDLVLRSPAAGSSVSSSASETDWKTETSGW